MAGFARFHARDLQLFHGAPDGVPEIDLDLVLEVTAGLLLDFHFSTATAAAKELAEEVAKACATAGASANGPGRAAATASAEIEAAKIEVYVWSAAAGFLSWGRTAGLVVVGVEADLIVHLTFFCVGQNVVSF